MMAFNPQDVETLGGDVLRAGPICDECLGRIASRLGSGMTNARRGELIRQHLGTLGVEGRAGRCWVCGDVFSEVEALARAAVELGRPYEFSTYLFGVKLTSRQEQMESFYAERFPSPHRETMKHSLNRALGMAFERLLGRDATVAFVDPHMAFVVDLGSFSVSLHCRSLYLYSRYRKLERGIPQTRWPCRTCRGRGCEACGFSGKQYPTSVEELIAQPLIALAKADDAHLHGAGREDIDARMLGAGRPFVLELVSPRVRSIVLGEADAQVREHAGARVEISPLRFVERRAVKWVKEAKAEKTYRALVAFDGPVDEAALQRALGSLLGEIAQQTPRRVSHRRADRIRRRTLHSASGSVLDSQTAQVELHGDGGLYIKELVSGDEGRTQPSLAGRLGMGARVTELDVLAVHSPDVPHRMELSDGLS